jgi:hypothetical protein
MKSDEDIRARQHQISLAGSFGWQQTNPVAATSHLKTVKTKHQQK